MRLVARCKAGGKAVQAMEQSHSLMDEFVSEGMSVAMFKIGGRVL